uniref:Dymeclin n=1 Tax=Rhinolophus ferrumequinum TaxID=59479 RepID=A0A671FAU3_RHIFE
MGSNSSRIGDLPKNEYLKKIEGTESVSENDPFWNQLLSFSFPAPTSSTELKLLEEATISVCRSLVENNPQTGNLGALIKVFLSRNKELKLSAECQNHIFIWQTHNALFIICCLLKVFIGRMSKEELQLHFTYEDKSPGSYSYITYETSAEKSHLLQEHMFSLASDRGGSLYRLASDVATRLWTVFTLGSVGSKAAAATELSSPLTNQSLLLLLVLANLTDAADTPNPYRQAITSFKKTPKKVLAPRQFHRLSRLILTVFT